MTMAARRKGSPTKREQYSFHTLLLIGLAAALISLCLCAVNVDLLNGKTHTRLETCRIACDERLQSAALESHVPSSLSPSAVDSLFLRQVVVDSHSTFQGRVDRPADVGSKTTHAAAAAGTARPRRLPTLIKILTGFGDEPSSNNNSIIARIERPHNPAAAHQVNQRRGGSNKDEPLSHEDTVQIAAAAAAAAVFSKSIRVFGNNRMRRVNSEWETALRWIAGWDQQQQHQQQQPQMPHSSNRSDRSGSSSNRGVSNDASHEGFDNFVGDLARMLESCISQCVEDEQFEALLEKDEAGPGEVSMGSSSIVNMVLRSIFGWAVGFSFSKISFGNFGKIDMISPDIRFVMARTFQLAASSVAVYAIHSLWGWASPAVFDWYSSLGYSESPEWLIEHENELKQAKTSRSRQKKKKRKQSNRLPGSRSKAAPNNDAMRKESHIRTSARRPVESASEPEEVEGKQLNTASEEKLQQTRASNIGAVFHSTAENTVPASKDSDSQASSTTVGIPSVISYTSTSASSSPSIKPIGNHLEDRCLQRPPQPLLRLNLPLAHKGPLLSQLPHQRSLPVPTQEQRNEAAKQLREFQNAQIQRLLLQRKLSQSSSASRLSAPAPLCSRLLSAGTSFHSTGNTSTASSGQQSKVLKPPPGLSHPSETPLNLDQQDKAFLTDNELFLSKLLDDEDDDVIVPSLAPSSPPTGIELMSPQSSLDPSAAPFVSAGKVDDTQVMAKSKETKGDDVWQTSSSELLKESSPVRIKGVYGGSVW